MALPLPVDKAGLTALDAACSSPHSPASRRCVAQLSSLNVEAQKAHLDLVVILNLASLLRCALSANFAVICRDTFNVTLVVAAQHGCANTMKLLLDAGADHRATDPLGFPMLYIAAAEGYADCVRHLLAAGADANAINPIEGNTALMNAIIENHMECVKVLRRASDLRVFSRDGFSALHACIMTGNLDAFELLLPLVGDVDERTPPNTAPVAGSNNKSGHNKSALHLACEKGQQQMAKALLKRGADRMGRDGVGRTPLFIAAQHGHLSCCVLLLGQPGKPKMTPAEVDARDTNAWRA